MHRLEYEVHAEYRQDDEGIVIPAKLRLDSKLVVPFWAKIDTGSEFCLFQRDYAERLGLVVEHGQYLRCRTATGSIADAYGHELTLVTFGFELTGVYYFFADESISKNLLGRIGWLNRVRLGIDDTANPGLLFAALA